MSWTSRDRFADSSGPGDPFWRKTVPGISNQMASAQYQFRQLEEEKPNKTLEAIAKKQGKTARELQAKCIADTLEATAATIEAEKQRLLTAQKGAIRT